MHRGILLVLLVAFLVGLAPQVRADGLIANWLLNQSAGSTSFPDSGPNNLTASCTGTDRLDDDPRSVRRSPAPRLCISWRGWKPGQQRCRRQR